MKKKTKIALSILGVFIVLLAATTVFLASQGFFRYIESPEIEYIKFADDTPVSFKDMQAAYEKNKEMFKDSPEVYEDSYLDLGESGINYTYEVTFEDGTIEEFSSLDKYPLTKDGMHTVYISSYVSYKEFVAAKNEGKDNVTVYVEAEIYKADYDPAPVDTYEGKTVKTYTDAVVLEIEPLFDEALSEDRFAYELESKEFRIKYADGTEKTLSPEPFRNKDLIGYEYYRYKLDGSPLIYTLTYREKSRTIAVRFLDCRMEFPLEEAKEEPEIIIEKFKLKDYEFNSENKLCKITYTAVKTDGETVELSTELNKMGYFSVCYVDGYAVTVRTGTNHKADKVIIAFQSDVAATTQTEEIDAPEKISFLDTINFEYFGAVFFAFLQGIFD